jgi:hypothetical protein
MPRAKHTILFLAANPQDSPELALKEECAAVERVLQRSTFRDHFELCSRWAADANAAMIHLNDLEPAILHFSGHGARSGEAASGSSRDVLGVPVQSAGAIVLQAGAGSAVLTEAALAAMVASASPSTRVVVLNACYSAGLAAALCEHIDGVVGMDGAIEDRAARSFATALYGALGEGRSLGAAVADATAALVAERSHTLPVCRTRAGVTADDLLLCRR